MLTKNITDRIDRQFSRRSNLAAISAAGSIVAAGYFGVDPTVLAAGLHAGFIYVASKSPLTDPRKTSRLFFSGAAMLMGSMALGSADMVAQYGGAIPEIMNVEMAQIKDWLGDNVGKARDMFTDLTNRSVELASVWRATLSDSISSAVSSARDTIVNMIPDDPKQAAKGFGSFMLKAVEGLAVAKGMIEGFDWLMKRMRKTADNSAETEDVSKATCLKKETVSNVTINIAISGEDGAKNAAEQLKQLLDTKSGRKIVFDDDLIQNATLQQSDPDLVDLAAERDLEDLTLSDDHIMEYRNSFRSGSRSILADITENKSARGPIRIADYRGTSGGKDVVPINGGLLLRAIPKEDVRAAKILSIKDLKISKMNGDMCGGVSLSRSALNDDLGRLVM